MGIDNPISGGGSLPAGNINDHLIFDGTNWVAAPDGTVFTFSVSAFSDGQSSPQEIGVGVWKAIGALSFTAAYANGPATGAHISRAGWADLVMLTPFTGPIVSLEAVNYPAAPGSVSFALHASKGVDSASASESVSFYNNIFWGVSTKNGTYLEADVEGLASSVISNTKGRTVTVNPAATYYIIYALPVRLGTVVFWVGGFEGGFLAPETVSITNASGFTEDYYVYRSTNSGLGSTTVVVV